MNHPHYRLKLLKKLVIVFLFVGSQLLLLGFYYNQEDFLANLNKPYLQEIYWPIYKNKLANIFSPQNSLISKASFSFEKAQSVPILLYHGVVIRDDGSNVNLKNFHDQMFVLKKAGFETITLNDYYQFVQGKKELPTKSFLLTFDDGRSDSFYPVDPILKELDYEAIIFIITNSLEDGHSRFHLNKKEIKKMLKTGRWEIQPHAYEGHRMVDVDPYLGQGHFYSNKMWLAQEGRLESRDEYLRRINDDLYHVQDDLFNQFGIKSYAFAYPYGDNGQVSKNIPKNENVLASTAQRIYPLTFIQTWDEENLFNYPGENSLESKRIEVRPNWTAANLLNVLTVYSDKKMPFKDNFKDYQGWVSHWGEVELGDSLLKVKVSKDSKSTNITLSGTRTWSNYALLAKLKWVKGSDIALVGRYVDDENFLLFRINDQSLALEQKIDGQSETLKEVEFKSTLDKNNFVAGLSIQGNKIQGRINQDILIESDGVSEKLKNGEVGFQSWDDNEGNSEILVQNFLVTDSWPKEGQLVNFDH